MIGTTREKVFCLAEGDDAVLLLAVTDWIVIATCSSATNCFIDPCLGLSHMQIVGPPHMRHMRYHAWRVFRTMLNRPIQSLGGAGGRAAGPRLT